MKIPYGLSNFKKVITEGYLYIDKTVYIEKLENYGNLNILLRPRRFGKSLFLSSLWHYYDVRFRDDFEAIFAKLYIGKNPTALRNSYKILFMEFSGLDTDDQDAVFRSFKDRIDINLRTFLDRYQYSNEKIDRIISCQSPAAKMDSFFEIIKDEKIYILIDEYDHFANTILGDDLQLFQKIVGRGGFVRSFYETIKTATQTGVVDRLFITGVTSITLDSLTSGFNIVDNLTHNRKFNEAIGFTSQETGEVITPLADKCELDKQLLLSDLASWYNGYLFSDEAEERVYNSNMLLYFLKNFNLDKCRYPGQMLDENIISDYRKILQYFAIGDGESNYQVLEELIATGELIATHKRKLDIVKSFDRDDFISLLFYMGFITIKESDLGDIKFIIPNHVIERLYFEYFKIEVEQRGQIKMDNRQLKEAIKQLALHDNPTPFIRELGKVLALLSNRDFLKMDEKHIKAIVLTLLYQSEVYFIKSEAEINNKYPDILLLERNPIEVKHQFLFELKLSKKGDGKAGWEAKKSEGIRQVQGYLDLPDITTLAKLRSYLILTNGSEVEIIKVGGQ